MTIIHSHYSITISSSHLHNETPDFETEYGTGLLILGGSAFPLEEGGGKNSNIGWYAHPLQPGRIISRMVVLSVLAE